MNTTPQTQALAHALQTAIERINAIEDTLGALAMLATRHMAPDTRTAFGEGIAALSAAAEKQGDMASATLLTGLHAAVAHAPGA